MVSKNNRKNNRSNVVQKKSHKPKNITKIAKVARKEVIKNVVTPITAVESEDETELEMKNMLESDSDASEIEPVIASIPEKPVVIEAVETIKPQNKAGSKRKFVEDSDEKQVTVTKKIKVTESEIVKPVEKIETQQDLSEVIEVEQKVSTQIKSDLKVKNDEVINRIFADQGIIENEAVRSEVNRRLKDTASRTIVINNVKPKFSNSDVLQICPDRVSCLVAYDVFRHRTTGTVFVDFRSTAEAEKALESIQNIKPEEDNKKKHIKACQFNRQLSADDVNCRRLVLNNLSVTTKEADLKAIFSNASTIDFLPLSRIDRKMTRVAFAEYDNVAAALTEMDALHGTVIQGNPVHVRLQNKKKLHQKPTFDLDGLCNLLVVGIKKKDQKKILNMFPFATNVTVVEKRGMARVVYANADNCRTDRDNAIANKKSSSLKIFYDTFNVKARKTKKLSEKKKNVENAVKKMQVKKKHQKKFVNK